jgi:hypothetical protein
MARNGQARVRSLFTIERYMHDIQEVLLTVATRKRRNRAAGALVPAARV